eukprot:15432906-Alexandrium_andersonii.AAC.1
MGAGAQWHASASPERALQRTRREADLRTRMPGAELGNTMKRPEPRARKIWSCMPERSAQPGRLPARWGRERSPEW